MVGSHSTLRRARTAPTRPNPLGKSSRRMCIHAGRSGKSSRGKKGPMPALHAVARRRGRRSASKGGTPRGRPGSCAPAVPSLLPRVPKPPRGSRRRDARRDEPNRPLLWRRRFVPVASRARRCSQREARSRTKPWPQLCRIANAIGHKKARVAAPPGPPWPDSEGLPYRALTASVSAGTASNRSATRK